MKIKKKVWPEYFEKILDGSKTYELRLADFTCKVGDVLILQEWDPKTKKYTGRELEKQITYIGKTKNSSFWSKEDIDKHGYQILALGNTKGKDYIGVSAGAMIFNERGELFLSKRSQQAKNERGCWETPGGSVDFGETLEQAVKREIKEEYGIDIDILEQFPAADHIIPNEHQHWVATTFLAKVKKGQTPKIMEPNKCDAISWFSLDNLPKPLSIITQLDLRHYHTKNQPIKDYVTGSFKKQAI